MIPSSRMFVSCFSCSCAPDSFASLPEINEFLPFLPLPSSCYPTLLSLIISRFLKEQLMPVVSLPLLSLWIWNSDHRSNKTPLYLCRGSTTRNLCSQKSCPSWEFLKLPPHRPATNFPTQHRVLQNGIFCFRHILPSRSALWCLTSLNPSCLQLTCMDLLNKAVNELLFP